MGYEIILVWMIVRHHPPPYPHFPTGIVVQESKHYLFFVSIILYLQYQNILQAISIRFHIVSETLHQIYWLVFLISNLMLGRIRFLFPLHCTRGIKTLHTGYFVTFPFRFWNVTLSIITFILDDWCNKRSNDSVSFYITLHLQNVVSTHDSRYSVTFPYGFQSVITNIMSCVCTW